MQKLTKQQAIILTGFTGITCCNFGDLQEEVDKRLGYPTLTHQYGDQAFVDKVKELFREDFISICTPDED